MEKAASKRFKKRLRELRKKCGWTQEQAAEACCLGYKVFQLYELGIKQNPGLLTLEKIAHGFGLDISELLSPDFPEIPALKSLPPDEKSMRKPVNPVSRAGNGH